MLGMALLAFGGWKRWPIWAVPLLALLGGAVDFLIRRKTTFAALPLGGAYLASAVAVHTAVTLLEYAFAYCAGRVVRSFAEWWNEERNTPT